MAAEDAHAEHIDLELDAKLVKTLRKQAAEKGLTLDDWILSVLSALSGGPAATPSINYSALAGAAGYTFAEFLRKRRAVGIKEGKTKFPEIIRRAKEGEPITISIGADPAALIIPLPVEEREPGGLETLLSRDDRDKLGAALDQPLPAGIIDAVRSIDIERGMAGPGKKKKPRAKTAGA